MLEEQPTVAQVQDISDNEPVAQEQDPGAGPSRQPEEQAAEEFPLDELLDSHHPREMLPLFTNDMPRGGPVFDAAVHKPKFFSVSPYTQPKDSFLLHFWTQEQAIYYTRMLFNQDVIFKHQYLDIPSLYSTDCFQNITEAIDRFHAHRMFSTKAAFNPELIKQFFASLYVTGDQNRPETWNFSYMIQGKDFHLTAGQLLELIDLPRFEGKPDKIHSLPPMSAAEFSVVMDPEIVGDGCPEVPMPKHLIFQAKTWFYILSKSLIPILNVHDEYPIPSVVQHAIVKLVNGIPFDFEDCFIRTLVDCAEDPDSHKPYAPWIMSLCNFTREKPFPS